MKQINEQINNVKVSNAINEFINDLKTFINENYNAIIDALINQFGKDIVLSTKCDYTLSQSDLKKIFKILNQHLFRNSITYAPVLVWPTRKLIDKLNYHIAESGITNEFITNANFYGVHSAICEDILDSNQNIISVKIRDDYILMNGDKLIDCTFIFVVACICHEMIHLYDRQVYKDYYKLALIQSQTGKSQEFHNTPIFKQKSFDANMNGIHVIDKINQNDSHENVNKQARYILKTVIGEHENSNDMIVQSDQRLFVKNKKTGKGILMHFD